MKRFKCAIGEFMVLVICMQFLGCGPTRVSVPSPENDHLPVITIRAIPVEPTSNGDIEKGTINSRLGAADTQSVSNVDDGMSAQFTASAINGDEPATTGGVQNLSFTLESHGTTLFSVSTTGDKDSSGMVPRELSIFETSSSPKVALIVQFDAPVIATVTATNFNGQVSKMIATYVPLDPNQRHKSLSREVNLEKETGRDRYVAHFLPDVPAPNGILETFNGSLNINTSFNLIRPDVSVSRCLDLTVSVTITPGSPSLSGDIKKLYDQDNPPLGFDIVGCTGGTGAVPNELPLKVIYKLN
jgi:hypothetical protein